MLDGRPVAPQAGRKALEFSRLANWHMGFRLAAYSLSRLRSCDAGRTTARSCPKIKLSSRSTRMAAGHGLIWTTRPEKRVARAGGRSTAVWTMKGTRRSTRTSIKAELSPSTKFTSKIAASMISFERKVMPSAQLAAGPTTLPPASATASARSKEMYGRSSATRTDTWFSNEDAPAMFGNVNTGSPQWAKRSNSAEIRTTKPVGFQ